MTGIQYPKRLIETPMNLGARLVVLILKSRGDQPRAKKKRSPMNCGSAKRLGDKDLFEFADSARNARNAVLTYYEKNAMIAPKSIINVVCAV